MPGIIQVQGGGLPRLNSEGHGELTPLSWLVSDFGPELNPFDLPEIPRRGSVLHVRGIAFTCDEVLVEQQINENDLVVSARFSTDGRFAKRTPPSPELSKDYKAWTIGYKKVPMRLPIFVLGKHYYTDAEGNRTSQERWLEDETQKEVQVEFMTLSISVRLKELTTQDIIAVIRKTRAQIGVMHVFPAMPEFYWVCQPPRISNDRPGELRIDYAWESDPGNSAPELLDSTRYVVPPWRPSFFQYVVRPGQDVTGKPTIEVVDAYPERVVTAYDASGAPVYGPNPFYKPYGWAQLPGEPI